MNYSNISTDLDEFLQDSNTKFKFQDIQNLPCYPDKKDLKLIDQGDGFGNGVGSWFEKGDGISCMGTYYGKYGFGYGDGEGGGWVQSFSDKTKTNTPYQDSYDYAHLVEYIPPYKMIWK
jgi:hypothetical protein